MEVYLKRKCTRKTQKYVLTLLACIIVLLDCLCHPSSRSTRPFLFQSPLALCLSIYLWLYSLLFGLGRLFSFLIFLHSRQDSLDGGSARRKAATCTQDSTQTQNKHIQISTPCVRFQPTIPAFQRAKTVHALHSAATVIGITVYHDHLFLWFSQSF
jgi:hypothetical protein